MLKMEFEFILNIHLNRYIIDIYYKVNKIEIHKGYELKYFKK